MFLPVKPTYMSIGKAEAYPNEHLSSIPLLRRLLALITNIYKARWACQEQHSSLFVPFVNYGLKKFYNIDTPGTNVKNFLQP